MTQDVEEFLAHFGVKGMKWGVRKEVEPRTLTPVLTDGIKMSRDGSIVIEKGASLQRLVRSSGKSMPMKDLTYASINNYDNSRYIKTIGGKGFFGGGRDQILGIQATQRIQAPSVDEATAIVSNRMLTDAKFREKNTNMLGVPIPSKQLEQIRQDPTGSTAKAWYEMTNQKLTFDAEFDADAPFVQQTVKADMLAKGFNALRDENDVSGGISKSPIIIFNPENSLKVTSITDITDDIRKANKQQLKNYKSQGKDWLDKQLYG